MISQILLVANLVCINGPYIGNGVAIEIKNVDAAKAEVKVFDTELWRGRPFKLKNKQIYVLSAQTNSDGETHYSSDDKSLEFSIRADHESGSISNANFTVFEKGDLKCHPGNLDNSVTN